MKLVDEKTIAKAETVFCSELSSVIDLATIGKIIRKHYNLRISGDVLFQDVDVVVHNSQIALKFDYLAHAYFSIFMDRSGSFLAMEETEEQPQEMTDAVISDDSLVDANIIRDRETQLAEAIAAAIDRETLARLIQLKIHATLSGRMDFFGARFTVYESKPVYNLIYQGEIAISFLVDENGRFLDFAKSHEISDADRNNRKETHAKDTSKKEDLFVNEEKDILDSVELAEDAPGLELVEDFDELEIESIDDDELKGLEAIVLGDMEDDSQKNASN